MKLKEAANLESALEAFGIFAGCVSYLQGIVVVLILLANTANYHGYSFVVFCEEF